MQIVPFDGWVKRDGVENYYPRGAAPTNPVLVELQLTTYDSANVDTDKNVGNADASHWRSQGFQVAANAAVGKINLWLKTSGTPTGGLTLYIQTDSGGLPSGTVVTNGTSSQVAAATVTNTYAWVTFYFLTYPALTASTQYHLVLKRSVADDASNYFIWGADASSPGYTGGTGEVYKLSTTTWSSEATDMAFDCYADSRWQWSPYSQLVASTSADFIPTVANVCFVVGFNYGTGPLGTFIEIEYATGGAGSEVPLASFADAFACGTIAGLIQPKFSRTFYFAPKVIPAGTRLSVRWRISMDRNVGCTPQVLTFIGGYDSACPVFYPMYSLRAHGSGVHKAVSAIATTGSPFILTTGSPAWAYGSWVTIIDPAPADLLVWGAARLPTMAVTAYHDYLELGTGATGATGDEVTRTRIAYPGAALGSGGVQTLRFPLLVKKGERLAGRIAGSTASKASQFMFMWEQI